MEIVQLYVRQIPPVNYKNLPSGLENVQLYRLVRLCFIVKNLPLGLFQKGMKFDDDLTHPPTSHFPQKSTSAIPRKMRVGFVA